jgi:methylphosphotriester-DNA--protein-cysteine methyltransferase
MSERRYRIWRQGRLVPSARPGAYAGIRTQKIFGRLDCWSGKRAYKENRVFFLTWEDAIEAGYRPCRHCRPVPKLSPAASATGNIPEVSRKVFRRKKPRLRLSTAPTRPP